MTPEEFVRLMEEFIQAKVMNVVAPSNDTDWDLSYQRTRLITMLKTEEMKNERTK